MKIKVWSRLSENQKSFFIVSKKKLDHFSKFYIKDVLHKRFKTKKGSNKLKQQKQVIRHHLFTIEIQMSVFNQ